MERGFPTFHGAQCLRRLDLGERIPDDFQQKFGGVSRLLGVRDIFQRLIFTDLLGKRVEGRLQQRVQRGDLVA